MPARGRPRVTLVREWDAQMGGSGCCGRLGGDFCREMGDEDTWARTRRGMEAMGAVYRAVYDTFGDTVELNVVDPRNTAWLLPTVWRDGRRRGLPVSQILRQLARGVGTGAVICDGRVLVKGGALPDPDDVVAALLAELTPA